MDETPESLFQAGRKALPRWGQADPGGAQKRHAVALLRRAAEAGHPGALEALAGRLDPENATRFAIALAKLGEDGPLVSQLTDGSYPPEHGRAVLAAARAGEAWAMLAVGTVYGMGIADGETGEPLGSRDGAWGWLPGAADPDAEGAAWVERAVDAGFPPAHMVRVFALRREDPAAALAHLEQALLGADRLGEKDRLRAQKLYPELLEASGAPLEAQVAAYRRLAEAGNADALFWLGERHRIGDGLPKDLAAARELYGRAAEAGSVEGWRELGKLREKGQGGPKDLDGARAAYEQAAELGADPYARKRLVKAFGLAWYGTE